MHLHAYMHVTSASPRTCIHPVMITPKQVTRVWTHYHHVQEDNVNLPPKAENNRFFKKAL